MYNRIEDIDDLAGRFESVSITAEEWTHHAHLTVGIWHLLHYSKEESIIRLRSRIISMNNIHGTPNSATRGYHETITLYWVWLLDEYIRRNNCGHELKTYNDFLNSIYQKSDLLFQFYTREKLFSVEARAVWVQPDVKELDFDVIS
jgi:hypothetical protein